MKWLHFFLLLICQARLSGQGIVDCGNNGVTPVINGLTGLPATMEEGIGVGLFYAPDGVTDESQFISLTQSTFPPGATMVGRLQPGLYGTIYVVTPATTPPCGFAMFQVRAWEKSYGLTFDEALNAPPQNGRRALVGKSSVLRVETACGLQAPAPLLAYGLNSFSVEVVPEPDVLSLLLLGAVFLTICCSGRLTKG